MISLQDFFVVSFFYFIFAHCKYRNYLYVTMQYTLNCNGRLVDLENPQVMGILNVTPDSFYADSREQTEDAVAERTRQILNEGGSIIDIGACSTRPDSKAATAEEEMERLRWSLPIVRREAPEAVLSVDTFRPDVARMAVEEYGVDIVNDVEGSKEMFRTVSRLRVPYIFTSRKNTVRDVMMDAAKAVDILRSMGQKDIIIDPGFGFGKTVEENYALMSELERLQMLELPLLVGISRKSMISRLLGCTADDALNGTTVLNTIALMKGASILRVHDVREAAECVKIVMNNRR